MVNGDPYRSASQSSDRRVINRSGSGAAPRGGTEYEASSTERYPPTQQQSASVGAAPRSSRGERQQSSGSKWPFWVVIILLVVALGGVAAWSFLGKGGSAVTGVDSSRYQAVFLINGQVFFGKLESSTEDTLELTNAYYLQAGTTAATLEDGTTNTENSGALELKRFGDDVYGLEDTLQISRNQVLYYENLEKDSEVTKLMEQNR